MAETQGLLFPEVAIEYPAQMHPQHRVMLESGSEHWCTGRDVLQLIQEFDEIGFDPFSNPHSLVPARRSVMLPENSLVIPWPTDCLVYANPPYGVPWCTSGHGSTDLSRRSATTEPYGARHEKDIGSETAGR